MTQLSIFSGMVKPAASRVAARIRRAVELGNFFDSQQDIASGIHGPEKILCRRSEPQKRSLYALFKLAQTFCYLCIQQAERVRFPFPFPRHNSLRQAQDTVTIVHVVDQREDLGFFSTDD